MPSSKLLNILCHTCENITSTLDYDEALYSLVKNACKCLKAKAGSIRLLDKSGNNLEIAQTFGLSRSYLKKGPVAVNQSPIDRLTFIVTPTSHNFFNIEKDLGKIVRENIDKKRDEIRMLCEQLVRAYDPCFSCSVH